MFDDELTIVNEELGHRLDTIEHALPAISVRELLQNIHSLKGIAQAYRLDALAYLAHALETRLASDGRTAPVRIYIDCMRDALDLGPGEQPQCTDLLLASIGTRLSAA